jgi:hypothetical protein
MALLQTATNEQIDDLERRESALPEDENIVLDSLASYVRKLWYDAFRAKKMDVEEKLLNNARQFNSEYSPSKLAEIKKLKGSELYVAISATKCNTAIAHIRDAVVASDRKPWDMEPTPLPELPDEIAMQIEQNVMAEATAIIKEYSVLAGIDPMTIFLDSLPQIKERIRLSKLEKAQEGVDEAKHFMDDQLVEGGWYDEIIKTIHDMVIYKAGILKGPIYRRKKLIKRVLTPNGYVNEVVERIIPVFERRSPFNIYPSPDMASLEDGYIFDLIPMSIHQLSELRGIEGFDSAAIAEVVSEYQHGGLRDWTTLTPDIREAQQGGISTTPETDLIDVLEYHGRVPGESLLEWGMSPAEIQDPVKQYDVNLWLVGNRVLKAVLNPDPMGKKPFSIKSYVEIPGSIWGFGLCDLIEDLQTVCNAIGRAIVNNAGIASGPLVEFNKTRLPLTYDQTLYPWKTIESEESAMSGTTPAVRFYQPTIIVDQLLKIFDYFTKLADQYTIPGFAHGNMDVGGAGKTASGLSMLMQSSNKIIQNVLRNIDDLIENSISLLYTHNLHFNAEKFTIIGDTQIVPKGTANILHKEQQTVRRTEFLQATANEIDAQILGLPGRRELLKQISEGLNIDNLQKVFPNIDKLDIYKMQVEEAKAVQQEQDSAVRVKEAGGSGGKTGRPQKDKKKAKSLDQSGGSMSGQDTRLISQKLAPRG